jgi:hypothetical protein
MSKNLCVTVTDELHQRIQLNRENIGNLSALFQSTIEMKLDEIEERLQRIQSCQFCENEVDPNESLVCHECERIVRIIKYFTESKHLSNAHT